MKQGLKNILLSAAAAITVFVMAQTPAFAATDTTATADMAATDTAATQEAGSEEGGNGEVDVQGIIFGHINDSYEWHITDIGGKSIAIYLPVIIHSKTSGWHCFLSSKIAHGHEYEGFYISTSEKYDGKIVERGPDGEEIRPFDISITKNVLSLIISSALLVTLILCCARWYKKHDVLKEAPKGVAALLEPVIEMINDDVIKDAVGPNYARYSPYLLTAFFFILINNLLGIIPIFPGGANLTGNIAVTFVLALCTFLAVNLTTNGHYWREIFWPEAPMWIKPILIPIEMFGMFTKPLSLMIRLFANIMAGHALILCIVSMIFITIKMGAIIGGSMTVVSVGFGIFMDCFEILVAFIQAYVFTILSAVFIGLAQERPHAEGHKN
ncbi:ATP synthase F0 subunit A [Muribaculum sp. An289]|nr:ATP synthase F0 subunit A [Muribaculum sp. An289]OUO43509.1 ATP synthase F0 subunit A [Muribaculum sp. An287]